MGCLNLRDFRDETARNVAFVFESKSSLYVYINRWRGRASDCLIGRIREWRNRARKGRIKEIYGFLRCNPLVAGFFVDSLTGKSWKIMIKYETSIRMIIAIKKNRFFLYSSSVNTLSSFILMTSVESFKLTNIIIAEIGLRSSLGFWNLFVFNLSIVQPILRRENFSKLLNANTKPYYWGSMGKFPLSAFLLIKTRVDQSASRRFLFWWPCLNRSDKNKWGYNIRPT